MNTEKFEEFICFFATTILCNMVSILTHSVKNASTIFAKFILSICRIRSILRQNPATQRFGGAIPLVSLYWAISAFHLSPLIIIGIGTQELHGRLEVRLEPVRQAHPIGIEIAEVKIPAIISLCPPRRSAKGAVTV